MSSVPPGRDDRLADDLEPEAERLEDERLGEVGAARADSPEREGLGLGLVGQVDPQLGEQVRPYVLASFSKFVSRDATPQNCGVGYESPSPHAARTDRMPRRSCRARSHPSGPRT